MIPKHPEDVRCTACNVSFDEIERDEYAGVELFDLEDVADAFAEIDERLDKVEALLSLEPYPPVTPPGETRRLAVKKLADPVETSPGVNPERRLGIFGEPPLALGVDPPERPTAKLTGNVDVRIVDIDYAGTIAFDFDVLDRAKTPPSLAGIDLTDVGPCVVGGTLELTFVNKALFEAIEKDRDDFVAGMIAAVKGELRRRLIVSVLEFERKDRTQEAVRKAQEED